MWSKNQDLHLYNFALFGVMVGFSFPLAFFFLDMKELGLPFSLTNLFQIFKSQNIYVFSSVLFPILFGSLGALFRFSITQNRRLQKQESYIKNVLNSLVDSLIVSDIEGKIQYANQTFYKLYDHNISSLKELIGPLDLKNTKQGESIEVMLKNRHGEIRTMTYTVYKLAASSLESKNNDQFILSIRDIEDQKKNEDIIQSQKEQLYEASKLTALGEMASGFAHEINNPLAIINGKLMVTERGIQKGSITNEAILSNIETCKKTVMRINKIILGLRNLERSTHHEMIEAVTIKDLVEDTVAMAHFKIDGKGIDFSIDYHDTELAMIECNRAQISQVLTSLIGNAFDAIADQSSSWVKLEITQLPDSLFKFIITDSGLGIPEAVQKRMFEPMYTTKAIGKGTGLGLSIARTTVEKHQGKLQLNNQSKNTSFEIILPQQVQVNKKVA